MGDILFGPLQFWHWLAFAAILVGIEMLAPGVFFLWLGVGAAATGVILFAAPDLAWTTQLLLFAAVSVVSIYGGRRWMVRNRTESDHPTLNERGAGLVGSIHVLDAPTLSGRGRMRVGDSTWAVRIGDGGDLPAGTRVAVTRVDGSVLEISAKED